MPIETILKDFGLSEKAVKVYMALLSAGSRSVRKIAEETGINRGTTYDILKDLQGKGLVSYYHKNKKQYFAAEDPVKLETLIKRRLEDFDKICRKVIDTIPELQSLHKRGGRKPVARFYEGDTGIKSILEDVLQTGEDYCVYSAESMRPFLYREYPSFTRDRIKRKINVRVIAIGKGGKERGLDERKWLSKKEGAPTYTIIYKNKVALISLDSLGTPLGVIIEEEGIYFTQKLIFETLWKRL